MNITEKIDKYLNEFNMEDDETDEGETVEDGYYVVKPLNLGRIWKVGDKIDSQEIFNKTPYSKKDLAEKLRDKLRKEQNKNTAIVFVKNQKIGTVIKY